MYALTNCTVYTGSDILYNHAVVIENDRIKTVCLEQDVDQSIERIDLNGANLSPGFIDVQLNGCGGVMLNDAISPETLQTMHNANLKSGCTSFLPTLITSSDENMRSAIEAQKQFQEQNAHQSLGLHLEGPYLNVARKGIHTESFIRQSDDEMIDFICQHADMVVKVTLAPEQNNPEHITRLTEAGIVVSIGHTAATYQQARDSFEHGITFATHLFNAMTPVTVREPGVVGAIFDTPDVYAGIIVDGHHVNYANIRMAKKLKGDKLVLVTDATAPAGAEMDQFNFVGNTVYVRDGMCVGADGTLGGSALTMIEAVENCVKHAGFALDETLRMATLYPARAIGLDHKLGRIKTGMIANLTIFNRNFDVEGTVVNGQFTKG
ncbi:N-acetylglucosamine-6-phosphate deacetylase [Vibrio sp. B1Z05]|uniref:N-acetylglucosamine-6-phosphate deacetylase n=1 Tax=Vibrio sp. B1Z05 TaxID=2654980 RepID=UPI00128D45E7|nr:N-acetylglucosamine-6-phosphate deacetylase [Vibrio sp. B1Z05]MPW35247.1 N-acetylglucosamine-6-phosphate deacetylase [Vibrio sp. B1Z05]